MYWRYEQIPVMLSKPSEIQLYVGMDLFLDADLLEMTPDQRELERCQQLHTVTKRSADAIQITEVIRHGQGCADASQTFVQRRGLGKSGCRMSLCQDGGGWRVTSHAFLSNCLNVACCDQ